MADESSDEKSEQPTEKRRQDAREKGTVAKSTEVNSVLVLLAGIFLLKMFSGMMFSEVGSTMRYFFDMIDHPPVSQAAFIQILVETFWIACKVVFPVAVGIMLVGILANIVQIGFLFTLKPLEPKLEKIDPISGFKRLFAMRSLVDLVKNIFKLAVIGTIAYLTIKSKIPLLLMLADAAVNVIWKVTLDLCFDVVLRISLFMIIIAILDYAWQRFEHEKKLKMSHQELKEERKQMEGDPLIKSRIRSLQREMARRRMMQEVPKATVVVTNPTHLAIAIRYDPDEMDTPRVIAKGRSLVAQRIKELAKENDIPVIEDKPLARAMYPKVEVGFDLPVEFFTAVAEILAYVYRLKNKVAA